MVTFYSAKHSKTNGIISIILVIISAMFGVFSLLFDSIYKDIMYIVLGLALFYFIAFLVSLNTEKKEKEINKKFEQENNISDSVFNETFSAEVVEYIYSNSFNLPSFLIEIKSGCIEINDKVLLPDGTKTRITNIFFKPGRPITKKAYSGETVKIILNGIRNEKKLSVGMKIIKNA